MLKICKILTLALIITSIIGFPQIGRADEPQFFVKEEAPLKAPRPLYVPDEVNVKFKPDAAEASIEGLLQAQQQQSGSPAEAATRSRRRPPLSCFDRG